MTKSDPFNQLNGVYPRGKVWEICQQCGKLYDAQTGMVLDPKIHVVENRGPALCKLCKDLGKQVDRVNDVWGDAR